jgi:predicted nucleic acid-binding protein
MRGAANVLVDTGPLTAWLNLSDAHADIPMSLADACLVRLSELVPHAVIFTLDADFGVYRRKGGSVITVLTPARL